MNTNDGFYLSHIPHTNQWEKLKSKSNSRTLEDSGRHCYINVTESCYVTSQFIQEVLEPFLEYKMQF